MRITLALFVILAGAATAAASGSVPVRMHRIEAEIDPTTHRLAVTDVIELERSPAGEPWRFLLHRDLRLEEALAGETKLVWEDREGWNPRHFWRRPPYGDLERFEPAREIEVQPPPSGWGEAPPVLTFRYAGIVADSLRSPERSYGRSFETTTGRIVEQGAYLGGSTLWVPWSSDDLVRFDLTVRGPADWRVVSQGDLVRDEPDGARHATRWVCDDPTEEIYLIAGPYQVRETDHRGIRIMSYCYENTGADVIDPYLSAAGESIDRFAELFGPYPYSKFALVENYWQTGYGMPGFTFLGDRVIRLPFIVTTSYPHEILHNWWGNGVYVHWERGNWCEGLTSYCADYFAKERESEAAARDYRRSTLVGYRDFAVSGEKDFALVKFRARDSAATQAVGYGKTLMVFHMLRRTAGDDAFFGALSRLYETKLFQRADWDDVRDAFEAETGRDLDDWFGQWVRRPGAPRLALADVTMARGGDGVVLRGVVAQEEPFYDLEVPIVVAGDEASQTFTVRAEGPRTGFEATIPFPPATVAADPGFDLFRLLHPEEVPAALSGVLGAEAVRVVVGAEEEGAVREALLAVAREWAGDSAVTVVEEGATPLESFAGGTWFFGRGPAAVAFLQAQLAGPATAVDGTFVGAGRLGGDADLPAALLLPESAEVVATIARKVHHYSKYGYLVFEGERNVAKGSWDAGDSPLVVRLSGS